MTHVRVRGRLWFRVCPRSRTLSVRVYNLARARVCACVSARVHLGVHV